MRAPRTAPLPVDLLLLREAALEEPIQGAVEELHVDGLRAGPAAPDAAEDGGDPAAEAEPASDVGASQGG